MLLLQEGARSCKKKLLQEETAAARRNCCCYKQKPQEGEEGEEEEEVTGRSHKNKPQEEPILSSLVAEIEPSSVRPTSEQRGLHAGVGEAPDRAPGPSSMGSIEHRSSRFPASRWMGSLASGAPTDGRTLEHGWTVERGRTVERRHLPVLSCVLSCLVLSSTPTISSSPIPLPLPSSPTIFPHHRLHPSSPPARDTSPPEHLERTILEHMLAHLVKYKAGGSVRLKRPSASAVPVLTKEDRHWSVRSSTFVCMIHYVCSSGCTVLYLRPCKHRSLLSTTRRDLEVECVE